MAKEYNFTYELVTYKWPSWLRKQTEKQRIIWAYDLCIFILSFIILITFHQIQDSVLGCVIPLGSEEDDLRGC